MTVATRLANAGDLASLRQKILAGRKSTKIAISVCAGTGCRAQGSMELFEEFQRELQEQNLTDVEVRATGCHGFCE